MRILFCCLSVLSVGVSVTASQACAQTTQPFGAGRPFVMRISDRTAVAPRPVATPAGAPKVSSPACEVNCGESLSEACGGVACGREGTASRAEWMTDRTVSQGCPHGGKGGRCANRRGQCHWLDSHIYPPNQPRHHAYRATEWYYYYRPYNITHVVEQRDAAPAPLRRELPYSHAFLQDVYREYQRDTSGVPPEPVSSGAAAEVPPDVRVRTDDLPLPVTRPERHRAGERVPEVPDVVAPPVAPPNPDAT